MLWRLIVVIVVVMAVIWMYFNEKVSISRLVDGTSKWYKFDDGDVSECKMEDDEEMKSQCFGGDYMGEVFDHIMKRLSYRKQKRWWNAYMLYYTRLDVKANNPTSREYLWGH